MVRVEFERGKQKDFLKKVIINANVPSLRSLSQFGFEISYSSWKNYFNENRTLPKELYDQLCKIGNISITEYKIKLIDDYWGQAKGGRISKRKKN